MTKEYDIAFSFAGEDRAYVEKVAEQVKARGISVFYDSYEEENLWGKDLYVHLAEIYRNKAKYILMFISRHYRDKLWAKHERAAAQSRALEESYEYILPARFDDTEIPGLLPTTKYIDLRTKSPAEVAILVAKKLGINPHEIKANAVPPPKNPALRGEARFNYSNNDGYFKIGDGLFGFTTHWSKADNTSIYCHAWSADIRGIALAPKEATLRSLRKVSSFDYTSSSRNPEIGRFVILQNTNGIYAALQILDIKDDSREDPIDELYFKYWIQDSGSDDFSMMDNQT